MSRCINDPAWAVETARATGMCRTCPAVPSRRKRQRQTGGTWAFSVWATGLPSATEWVAEVSGRWWHTSGLTVRYSSIAKCRAHSWSRSAVWRLLQCAFRTANCTAWSPRRRLFHPWMSSSLENTEQIGGCSDDGRNKDRCCNDQGLYH